MTPNPISQRGARGNKPLCFFRVSLKAKVCGKNIWMTSSYKEMHFFFDIRAMDKLDFSNVVAKGAHAGTNPAAF